MSEHKEPIPSRIYNSALGGHVAGARDIIDDGSGITLDELVGNKEYAPVNFSGMGRVILKKNIVNGVNTLTQSMMQATNTIYVIQYDYDLNDPNGENPITIPENCVLEFDGGSLGNGTIVGVNTQIIAKSKNCFALTCVLDGTWIAEIAYSDWFSIVSDCVLGENDIYISGTNSYQGFSNLFKFKNIKFVKGNYFVQGIIYIQSGATVDFCGSIIKSKYNNIDEPFLFINNVSNVVINNGNIIGWKQEGTDITGGCHGISIKGGTNIKIENISSSYFRGDGICISALRGTTVKTSYNVIISNCMCMYNHRQGISITGGENIRIINCNLSYTSGTDPQAGIDIEPNRYCVCKNIYISQCSMHGNHKGISILTTQDNSEISDIYIDSIDIENLTEPSNQFAIELRTCKNVYISNFYILVGNTSRGILFQSGNYKNIHIFNGRVIGNGAYTSMSCIRVVSNVEVNSLYIENVECAGFNTYGIELHNTTYGENVILTNINIHNCAKGITVPDNLSNVILNNVITNNIGLDNNGNQFPNWVLEENRQISYNASRRDFDRFNASTITPTLISSKSSDSIGQYFYDVNTNKPKWWNGKFWVTFNDSVWTKIKYTYNRYIANYKNVGEVVDIENPISSNYWCYAIILCNGGETFFINGNADSNARVWSFLDEDKKVIITSRTNVVTNAMLTTPSNAKYLILNSKKSQAHDSCYYDCKSALAIDFSYLKKIGETQSGINLYTDYEKYGNTPLRPEDAPIGYEYFDVNLGKPIWVKEISNNTAVWVDATGVIPGTPTSGTFANKPTVAANNIPVGFHYFCTNKQTTEGATNGIEIIFKGQDTTDPDNPVDVWVDALGRVVDANYPSSDALRNPVGTIYPKVIGTPISGNLAKFNNKDIEDAGVTPQV